MIYVIIWYIIGIISFLVGEKIFEGNVKVSALLKSFFFGIFGLLITVAFIVVYFDISINLEWLNKEVF